MLFRSPYKFHAVYRDYRRAMQEAELLRNFVRLADSVLVAAVAAQASLPLSKQM